SGGEPRLCGIAQRVAEVVGHAAARESGSRRRAGSEAIGVIPVVLGVDSPELDGEVRRPAIVLGVEAVRFAASGGADLEDLDVDSRKAVQYRLAGGARAGPGQHIDAAEPKRGERRTRIH